MELTKEIIERIYSLIEKSKTDGKIRKGVNEVTKSLERGEAKLSVSAEDISPAEITSHLPTIAKEKGIVHVTVPSKTELGAAAGLPVATASVAVVSGDSKLIDALLKDIKIITQGKAEEKPAKEEKAEEKPAKEEKAEEKPAKEEKAEEKPAKEEKAEEKPAKEEKAEEKPAKEEKAEEKS